MLWPYVWFSFMFVAVVATIVAAVMERKAQTRAKSALAAPQPLNDADGLAAPAADGFGEADPIDSFGDAESLDPFGEET